MIFVRLLAVILMWFLALQVWDIATLHVLRAVRTAGGVVRLLAGCVLGLCALALLYLTLLPQQVSAFSLLGIVTFLAALVAEFLIGDDVRALVRRR